MEPVGLLPCS